MAQQFITDTTNSKSRDVIFISHATPEDNPFTIWLASRLQADGYEVWIDKQALLGGEKFWQEIDLTIRNKAAKVLLVYSENICYQKQPGVLKTGVEKEKSLAESVAGMNGFNDFIILLNVDNSAYNLFIGADMLNQIPFYENWASGYTQLLKKLQKEEIVPTGSPVGDMSRWYENEYVINCGIKPLKEIYYDSWWPIPDLPEKYYIYVLANAELAGQIQQQSKYPVSKSSNIIASFHDTPGFEITVGDQTGTITATQKYELVVRDVLCGNEREGFPSARDAENQLRSLLQRVFHIIMRERGLRWHNMANKKLAYFFTARINPRIKFEYRRRSKKGTKWKNIFGKYLDSMWHFAISAKPVLTPQLAFSLKSHIVFTTDGHNLWEDAAKMHSARRQKGRLIFNEEWRDMLFAFLHALSHGSQTLQTELSPSFTLILSPWTNIYTSDFGYHEPKEKDRHNILEAENEYFDREKEQEDEPNGEVGDA